jgi:hypothetical protein
MPAKLKFKEQVEEIFGKDCIRSYIEYPKTNNVYIDVTEFTAEKLFELSDLLGTGVIRINPDAYYSGGGCDTCDYGSEHEKWIELVAQNVKFDGF